MITKYHIFGLSHIPPFLLISFEGPCVNTANTAKAPPIMFDKWFAKQEELWALLLLKKKKKNPLCV